MCRITLEKLAIIIFGSTLSMNVAAQGTVLIGEAFSSSTVTETTQYGWKLRSIGPSSNLALGANQSAGANFTIEVLRSDPEVRYSTGIISAHVCLRNAGSPTQGLSVVDQLEQRVEGIWTPLGEAQALPVTREMATGETRCWNPVFSGIGLDPVGEYRSHVTATIGFEGADAVEIYGPLAITVLVETIDEQATLDESFLCPRGFNCLLPWTSMIVTGSVTLTYSVTISNGSAFCGDFDFLSTSTLSLEDSSRVLSDTAMLGVEAGACGCTGGVRYWKSHPDLIGPLLPQYLGTIGGAETLVVNTIESAAQVLDEKSSGSRSNRITKLYAHLLATKLAIQNGADPTAIASSILAADLFLATHDHNDWGALNPGDQALVVEWQTALADYNLGVKGPGHCIQ